MTGFSETFSQYVMEVAPGGGSDTPETDPGAQSVLFVTDGVLALTLGDETHELDAGGYAYIPAGTRLDAARRRRPPGPLPLDPQDLGTRPRASTGPRPSSPTNAHIPPVAMPDTDGRWATTRFVDPDDLRHDMHVNIVTFQPGGVIPFEETHVMEHGLYVLEGKAVYRLNRDWVEVEAGDFMWLRAYCPQACYAAGPGPFRYLLYKDVNRHAKLRGPGAFAPARG